MEPIYANNAGTTWPKAPGVVEAASAALAAPPEASQRTLQAAHDEVCLALGIAQPERLLLTGSCTSALAILLSDLPLQAGDVVLTSALEHHALVRPIQQLVLARGVVHEVSPYSPSAPFDLDFARRVLRGGRVRLIALSGASNVTGESLPIDEIGELARAHGVPLLLDAAQTMGVLPIDVRTLPIDMLVFAGHKGPLAPHGIGGLWAAPHIELQSPAAVCEIGAEAGATRCASFPSGCDVGSINLAAAAGLATALRWRRAQTGDLYRDARAHASRLRRALRELPGCRVFGGYETPHTAAVSFLLDGLPLARAEAHFAQRGVTLRAGQHCAPLALQAIGAPQGTLRASFGPFNRESDVDAILAAAKDT
ncbi:MAG TPA: aminotransferase class V-fold PLP-dependent enzyme [Polyangiales bacterium]|nr:aminotransferase class V-fold PLP-dependent enzyme [Polyangiales bacterium]